MSPRTLLPCLTSIRVLLVRLVPVLTLGVLGGCSGKTASLSPTSDAGDAGALDDAAHISHDSAAPDAPMVTTDQAASDAANAYCTVAESCAPAYVTIAYGDVSTCISTLKSEIVLALGASGNTETAAQLEACAGALPMTSCVDILSRKTPAACKSPPGTLADGSPCEADEQCTGTRCRVAPNQACGTCTEPAPAGAPCGVDGDCDEGLACTGGACVAYGAMNASCDATHPCEPTLGCVGGVCTTPSPLGTSCAQSDECDTLHGAFCNKTCQNVSFAAPSAPCGLVGTALTLCEGPGGLCVGITAPTYQGTCAPPAASGAECDTVNGPLCGATAVCVCGGDGGGGGGDGGCAGMCTVSDPAGCH